MARMQLRDAMTSISGGVFSFADGRGSTPGCGDVGGWPGRWHSPPAARSRDGAVHRPASACPPESAAVAPLSPPAPPAASAASEFGCYLLQDKMAGPKLSLGVLYTLGPLWAKEPQNVKNKKNAHCRYSSSVCNRGRLKSQKAGTINQCHFL